MVHNQFRVLKSNTLIKHDSMAPKAAIGVGALYERCYDRMGSRIFIQLNIRY
jgi:hypothetical protein